MDIRKQTMDGGIKMSVCPICKKKVRRKSRIKRDGVWQHPHHPKYKRKGNENKKN